MYFNWTIYVIMIWLSWIDYCVCFGNAEYVEDSQNKIKKNPIAMMLEIWMNMSDAKLSMKK